MRQGLAEKLLAEGFVRLAGVIQLAPQFTDDIRAAGPGPLVDKTDCGSERLCEGLPSLQLLSGEDAILDTTSAISEHDAHRCEGHTPLVVREAGGVLLFDRTQMRVKPRHVVDGILNNAQPAIYLAVLHPAPFHPATEPIAPHEPNDGRGQSGCGGDDDGD